MNIVSVKNNPGQHDYDLQEHDKTVLKLRYKDDLHTARVETGHERRVLIIEDEGLLKARFVLKNEYGVRIGSLILSISSTVLVVNMPIGVLSNCERLSERTFL